MCIISIACDWNQVAYCSHSKAHIFAQESPIEKIKVPFWSAISVFSDGVLISVSTKCDEWVVYPERVTITYGPTYISVSCMQPSQATYFQQPSCVWSMQVDNTIQPPSMLVLTNWVALKVFCKVSTHVLLSFPRPRLWIWREPNSIGWCLRRWKRRFVVLLEYFRNWRQSLHL